MLQTFLSTAYERCRWIWHNKIRFLQLHYLYILVLCFLISALFYCDRTTIKFQYIDVLFMSVSAATNTGLNTVDMSSMDLYQLLLLFFASIAGSHIVVSVFLIWVRKYFFYKRFRDIVERNRQEQIRQRNRRRLNKPMIERQWSFALPHRTPGRTTTLPENLSTAWYRMPSFRSMRSDAEAHHNRPEQPPASNLDLEKSSSPSPASSPTETNQNTNNIMFADNLEKQRALARLQHEAAVMEEAEDEDHQLVHKNQLTRYHRYRIGGAEYRALDLLSYLVPALYVAIILVGAFALRIYVAASTYAQEALKTSNPKPVDPWLFSFFMSVSAFNNMGLSVLDSSMAPFLNAPAPLLILCFLIMAGHTGYPVVLRFIVWSLYKITPESHTMHRETLRYLLDHPRRCYTHLFPSPQTWWLLFVLIAINLVEIVVFLATNFWLPVLEGISWPSRVLLAIFQGVATRNAGFTALNILIMNPGTHIVYIIAMYISVYPVSISMRHSNVYQERELGIYSSAQDDNAEEMSTGLRRLPTISSVVTASRKLVRMRPGFYVATQIQRQLANEIYWVILGIFCVCVIEASAIMAPSPITALTVIYECVSCFANSGSSTGYPNVSTSQSGVYHTLSKLVLIALMYRGRHRGLPLAIDHAVLLPSEQLQEEDDREQQLRMRHAEIFQELEHHARWYNNRSTRSLLSAP